MNIQEIDKQIEDLRVQKKQIEEATLNETLLQMFSAMTKEQILAQIQEMMAESIMLKMEVKRLLLDEPAGLNKGIE
jgi:hypothetical protein